MTESLQQQKDELDKMLNLLESQSDATCSWSKPENELRYISLTGEFCRQHETERMTYPLGLSHGYPDTLVIIIFRKRVAGLQSMIIRRATTPLQSLFYIKCIEGLS